MRLKNLEIKDKKIIIDEDSSKKFIKQIIKEYSNVLYDDIIDIFLDNIKLLLL